MSNNKFVDDLEVMLSILQPNVYSFKKTCITVHLKPSHFVNRLYRQNKSLKTMYVCGVCVCVCVCVYVYILLSFSKISGNWLRFELICVRFPLFNIMEIGFLSAFSLRIPFFLGPDHWYWVRHARSGGDPAALKPVPICVGSPVLNSSFTLSLPQGPESAYILVFEGTL